MQAPILDLTDAIKKKFIGADELRKDLSDILEKMPHEDSRLIITQHGKPKAILLDLNTYLQLIDIQEDVIQPGYIDSLYQELSKVREGKGISHEELMRDLNLDV